MLAFLWGLVMTVMLTSNGTEIPFSDRYFGNLISTPAGSSGKILRESLSTRGYLLLRGALDPAEVRQIRAAYLAHFPASMFKAGTAPDEGVFSGEYPIDLPRHGTPGHPAYAFVRSEAFNTFVAAPQLTTLAEILLGGPAVRLRRTPLRHFVRGRGFASRAHTDYTYLDAGSTSIVTFWIPIGDCPFSAGGLIYLEDSAALDPSAIRGDLPTDRPDDARPLTHDLRLLADRTVKRWLCTDYAAGDLIVHSPFIVHASLNAQTDLMRVSIDLRFTTSGAAIDPRWSEDWSADDGY